MFGLKPVQRLTWLCSEGTRDFIAIWSPAIRGIIIWLPYIVQRVLTRKQCRRYWLSTCLSVRYYFYCIVECSEHSKQLHKRRGVSWRAERLLAFPKSLSVVWVPDSGVTQMFSKETMPGLLKRSCVIIIIVIIIIGRPIVGVVEHLNKSTDYSGADFCTRATTYVANRCTVSDFFSSISEHEAPSICFSLGYGRIRDKMAYQWTNQLCSLNITQPTNALIVCHLF